MHGNMNVKFRIKIFSEIANWKMYCWKIKEEMGLHKKNVL